MTEVHSDTDGTARTVADLGEDDEAAFSALTRLHRRELHLHCYRMLASFEDAEDLVQETFLRAWQKRANFQGRGSFRAWLYRIATNACLDFLASHERRVLEISAHGDIEATAPHVAWLQPYPDRLTELVGTARDDPHSVAIGKETIELAYVIAMQYLPPRQRAVLILRDVLDWSAKETAALLESSVPAVNGALQRARATLREKGPERDRPPADRPSLEQERQLVQQYVDATERCDADALIRLLRRDALFTMPPAPMAYIGAEGIRRSLVEGGFGAPPYDDFRCLVTRANGMPAVANYLRVGGEGAYRAFTLDVLRIEQGAIVEVTAFDVSSLFEAFGVPETLP